METLYLFSSSEGDVPVDQETLEKPFLIRPFVNHPFMTLGDFFSAVRDFVLQKAGRSLVRVLSRSWNRDVAPIEIDRLLIRYEKYGTLYQMASAEVFSVSGRSKFAVSAAVLPEAKAVLHREFDLLKQLNLGSGLPYLPEVYIKDIVSLQRKGQVETILMCLSMWFEGYHEWHFSRDEDNRDRIFIWDLGHGYRFASERDTARIIREASKILTLYYDMETCRRIFPWHHGAGDFVVRPEAGGIDVRLITARGYEPIRFAGGGEEINPLKGIIHFFLEMTVKMRLDRREGLAETIWVEGPVVQAVTEGFFQALRTRESKDDCPFGRVEDLVKMLKAIGLRELKEMLSSHMDLYGREDEAEFALIQSRLDDHSEEVFRVIRDFGG